MREETFYCNLCREKKEPKELLCLFWGSNDSKAACYYITKNIGASDKHICDNCRMLIKTFEIKD